MSDIMAEVPHWCLTQGCTKPFGHDLDPEDPCGRTIWCNWCDLKLRRSIAAREGQTLTAVAVGKTHDDPVRVFVDGRLVVRYDVLPRTCTC